jgi:hypothetical protein
LEDEPKLKSKLYKAFLRNEWIHIEVQLLEFKRNSYFKDGDGEEKTLLNESMESTCSRTKTTWKISKSFISIYSKRKLDEHHTSLSQSQFYPLLKKKRLLDVEVSETLIYGSNNSYKTLLFIHVIQIQIGIIIFISMLNYFSAILIRA